MTEEPRKKLQALLTEFDERDDIDTKYYEEEKKESEIRRASWGEIRDNKNSPYFERMVSAYICLNESQLLLKRSEDRIYRNILKRLIILATWSTHAVEIVLEQKTNVPAVENDKKVVEDLKKELSELQQQTANMKPYIDMLKIAIEKKNKWLNDNR